jgi:hypothetical protein
MGPTVNGPQTFRQTFRRSPLAKPSEAHQELHGSPAAERNQTFRETFRTFRLGDLQAGGGYLIPPGRVLAAFDFAHLGSARSACGVSHRAYEVSEP